MYDVEKLIKNIETVYNSPTSFQILKDFERVLDEYFDIYVYDNWDKGELLKGPITNKYWVTCYFMWNKDEQPDYSACKRMKNNGLMIKKGTSYFVEPVKIKKPDDIRPGTKKGKLVRKPICIIGIKMPKSLMKSVYAGQDMFKKAEAEQAETAMAPPTNDMTGGLPVTDAAGPVPGAPIAPGVI